MGGKEAKYKVVLGYGTCGIAAGATAVKEALEAAEGSYSMDLDIAGCMGLCFREPIVEVFDKATGCSVTYGDLTAKKVPQLLEEHIGKGQVIEDWVVRKSEDGSCGEGDFIEHQHRIVLRDCGKLNPESIDEYIEIGGYEAARKAFTSMTPRRCHR